MPRPENGPTRPAGADRCNGSIRIVVADDQPIDRKGLIGLLESQPDFQVVGEAKSGEEAIERCRALQPHVLITDLLMPGMDGVSAMPAVRAAAPETRVIAIAERGERRCVVLNPPKPGRQAQRSMGPCLAATDCLQLAVAQGVHGAIRRSAEPQDLFRAVREVAAGNAWYEPGTAARMMERSRRLELPGGETSLSARQLEVSSLIAEGHTNKEIGDTLGIGEATVKKHVREVLVKLSLQGRLQIGLYFARNPLGLRGVTARAARRAHAPAR